MLRERLPGVADGSPAFLGGAGEPGAGNDKDPGA
jgi:hypothetical protein